VTFSLPPITSARDAGDIVAATRPNLRLAAKLATRVDSLWIVETWKRPSPAFQFLGFVCGRSKLFQ
jgi:hypothetical protein